MKYRKKPVIIEAIEFDGRYLSALNIRDWSENKVKPLCEIVERKNPKGDREIYMGKVYIETLEGTMYASEGDYIIKGVQGEFYPCKPEIFEKTYELVE